MTGNSFSLPEGQAPPEEAILEMAAQARTQIEHEVVEFRDQCLKYHKMKQDLGLIYAGLQRAESRLFDELAAIGHPLGAKFVCDGIEADLTPVIDVFHQTPRGKEGQEPELIDWCKSHGFEGLVIVKETVPWQTERKFCEEQLAAGDEIPPTAVQREERRIKWNLCSDDGIRIKIPREY